MARGSLLSVLVMMFTVAGAIRRVIVTGGNKGIGLQICRKILADVPDSHVVLGSRSAARGEKAVASLIAEDPAAHEGRIETVELDVTDDASVAAAAATIKAKYSDEAHPLWGICNNAGVGFGRSIKETLATVRPLPARPPFAATALAC